MYACNIFIYKKERNYSEINLFFSKKISFIITNGDYKFYFSDDCKYVRS